MTDFVPRLVATVIPSDISAGSDLPSLMAWLVSAEARRDPNVCQWLNFLSAQYAQFRIIDDLFPALDPRRVGMKDQRCSQTSIYEMLVIANQLFILRSYGVEGSVLECGCFKGFSSCCLSIACRRLGYPFVIADSFAGLPASNEVDLEGESYQVGDFTGTREEVEGNLRTFGDPLGVELIQGWYSDTLKGWKRPLAALWLDVDLWTSAVDVLNPCLPALDPRGSIFSHEFTPDYIKDEKITRADGAAGAIAKVMQDDDPDYRAAHAKDNLAIVGRRTSVCLQSFRLLNELIVSLALTGVAWDYIPRSQLERLTHKAKRLVGILRGNRS